MTTAYLALGSNLGERRETLERAIERMGSFARVLARSRVFETAPVGGPPGQPRYHNQVVCVETDLGARELLERCLEVERALGRDRATEVRWGPRTLDVDLLLYGAETIDEPGLAVPHPRLAERAFVLVPLAEIAPDVVVPGRGRAADLLRALGRIESVEPA